MYINVKPNKHQVISFNTTTMTSLGFIIVGTPPPPFIKERGRTFQKIESLGEGVHHFLLERGDKPVQGGLM